MWICSCFVTLEKSLIFLAILPLPRFLTLANAQAESLSRNATNPPPPPIALNHYFNSGFLYFNLPKFRQQFQQKFPASNILEQSLKLSKQYQLRFHDQDILNAIIQDDYQPLSFAYNFMVRGFGDSLSSPLNYKE